MQFFAPLIVIAATFAVAAPSNWLRYPDCTSYPVGITAYTVTDTWVYTHIEQYYYNHDVSVITETDITSHITSVIPKTIYYTPFGPDSTCIVNVPEDYHEHSAPHIRSFCLDLMISWHEKKHNLRWHWEQWKARHGF